MGRTLLASAASSGTGNRVMTSADGLNWAVRSCATDLGWRSIAWSPQGGAVHGGTQQRLWQAGDGEPLNHDHQPHTPASDRCALPTDP
ncbi:hypothetical protein AAJV73_16240 [Cyanobium sp. BSA11S]|uniref:hypothetical protein n=1 Tax=Cyanobium sp. BSA11S TaxID=3108224 RepID=UPI003D815315